MVSVIVAKGPERKSTSGGVMMMNGTVVEHWSRTQATPALSTAEAEILRGHQGSGRGSLGLSASSSRDRLQRCQSDRVKERTRKNQTRSV